MITTETGKNTKQLVERISNRKSTKGNLKFKAIEITYQECTHIIFPRLHGKVNCVTLGKEKNINKKLEE